MKIPSHLQFHITHFITTPLTKIYFYSYKLFVNPKIPGLVSQWCKGIRRTRIEWHEVDEKLVNHSLKCSMNLRAVSLFVMYELQCGISNSLFILGFLIDFYILGKIGLVR